MARSSGHRPRSGRPSKYGGVRHSTRADNGSQRRPPRSTVVQCGAAPHPTRPVAGSADAGCRSELSRGTSDEVCAPIPRSGALGSANRSRSEATRASSAWGSPLPGEPRCRMEEQVPGRPQSVPTASCAWTASTTSRSRHSEPGGPTIGSPTGRPLLTIRTQHEDGREAEEVGRQDQAGETAGDGYAPEQLRDRGRRPRRHKAGKSIDAPEEVRKPTLERGSYAIGVQ